MKRNNPIKRYILPTLALAAMLPIGALAAGSATITSQGANMQIYWTDGAVRLDPGQDAGYMILRNDKMYSVQTMGGQTRVLNMTGMMQGFRGMAKRMAKSGKNTQFDLTGTVESIEPTGATQTVAGIEGRVYKITMTMDGGDTTIEQAVLTDNPLVVEMTEAYLSSMSAVIGQQKTAQLIAALPDDDRGLLRWGNDYVLTSISDKQLDPAMFQLPAEPTSFAEMMQEMIQKGMQQGMQQ